MKRIGKVLISASLMVTLVFSFAGIYTASANPGSGYIVESKSIIGKPVLSASKNPGYIVE
ncbi:hypothetical protein [Bacillus horti]|uniref:Uncharacterized protein n=1 Tax=Caldalkalibacillus horti TaxID=77523 RepID=A0ABT9W1S2_9BACI|nr:hypothetical protein [Bacillus horti]MDQ0167189.1 hypothetical protein [Bacillus horti]